MLLKELSDKEMERLIKDAKKGDKKSIQIIIEKFQGLIMTSYKKWSLEESNIFPDDYMQECNVKIMECIEDVSENNYWRLASLIIKSLENKTVDFVEKNNNFDNYNVLVEDITSLCDGNNLNSEQKFDDLVVSNMIADDSYNSFIKDKLSKEEDKALSSHISGQSLIEYAKEKGVKVESVKRTLRRAMNKIVNKEQLKEFHCLITIAFAFLKDIWDYIISINIAEIIELAEIIIV